MGRITPSRHDSASEHLQRRHRFCNKIKVLPDETLRRCEAPTFKAYLEWRVKNFRIKKESTIKCYWRRMLSKYIDIAGQSMDNGTELDIRDVGLLVYLSIMTAADENPCSGSQHT
jgi:hypothetical protein